MKSSLLTGYYISLNSVCWYFLDRLFKQFFEAAISFFFVILRHIMTVPFSSYLDLNNGLFSLFPLGTDDIFF